MQAVGEAALPQPHSAVRRGRLLLVGAHHEIVREGIVAHLDQDIQRQTREQEAADKKWFRENG